MERRPDPHVCVELFPVLPSLLHAHAVKDACVSPHCDRHHLQGWVSAGRLRRSSRRGMHFGQTLELGHKGLTPCAGMQWQNAGVWVVPPCHEKLLPSYYAFLTQ